MAQKITFTGSESMRDALTRIRASFDRTLSKTMSDYISDQMFPTPHFHTSPEEIIEMHQLGVTRVTHGERYHDLETSELRHGLWHVRAIGAARRKLIDRYFKGPAWFEVRCAKDDVWSFRGVVVHTGAPLEYDSDIVILPLTDPVKRKIGYFVYDAVRWFDEPTPKKVDVTKQAITVWYRLDGPGEIGTLARINGKIVGVIAGPTDGVGLTPVVKSGPVKIQTTDHTRTNLAVQTLKDFIKLGQPTKGQPVTMPKGLKKFYVGSNRTTADWTHATIGEAVKHARSLVESGQQEEAFVVQIVRVVKKKEQPIVVENFK